MNGKFFVWACGKQTKLFLSLALLVTFRIEIYRHLYPCRLFIADSRPTQGAICCFLCWQYCRLRQLGKKQSKRFSRCLVWFWQLVVWVDSNFWYYYPTWPVRTTVLYMSWLVHWISLWLGRIQCSTNYVCGLAWVLCWSFTILLVCCNIFYLYSVYEGSGLVMVMVEFQFKWIILLVIFNRFLGTFLCG